jgi:hypothetical protein
MGLFVNIKKQDFKKNEEILKKQRKNDEKKLFFDKKNSHKNKKRTLKFKFFNFSVTISNRFFILILIIFGCFLFLLIFINKENFYPKKVINWLKYSFLSLENGTSFPISISGQKVTNGNFLLIGKDVVMISDNSVMVFNHKAKKIYHGNHRFSNPVLTDGGQNFLTYDLYGKSFEINNKLEVIKSDKLEQNIVCAAVCDSGVYGVVTETKGYLSKMIIYSQKGEPIYEYDFADCLISHLCLNKQGNSASAVGLCSKDGMMKSAMYVFDFKQEKPKCFFEYDDVAFLETKFLQNGDLFAIGDKLACSIKTCGSKTDYKYDNKFLKSFDINEKGTALALTSGSNQTDSELHILRPNAELKRKIPTNSAANSVAYNGSIIAGLSDEKIVTYSENGKQLKQFDVKKDVKNIKITGRRLYLQCLNEIRILEI